VVVSEPEYQRLVDRARSDDRVLGLILTGSRARGPDARPDSDWDVRLVVRDDAHAEAEAAFATDHGAAIETVVFSLAGFAATADIGSESEWDRYSYVHARVVLDKLDGRISELVNAKAALPADRAREIAARALDAYINAYYRSAKDLRSGLRVEAQLDAAESVPPFLTALFGMHERIRPFNKHLRWELEQHPLGPPEWDAGPLLERLAAITSTGNLQEQQRLFRDVERLARARGLGAVVDGWQPEVAWLRGE
jgi:predicted nucleotidyltransferase